MNEKQLLDYAPPDDPANQKVNRLMGIGTLPTQPTGHPVNKTDFPETPRKPVTDEYHGVRIVADYRWLEDANDAAAKEWTERQNSHARAVLDQISCLEAVRVRVKELMTASAAYRALCYRESKLFALKSEPASSMALFAANVLSGVLIQLGCGTVCYALVEKPGYTGVHLRGPPL